MLNLILSQTEMEVLFGSDKSLINILTLADSDSSNLKKMVVFDNPSERL